MAAADLVLALTGASGAPYGVRLLEVLLRAGRTVHLTISPAAVEVIGARTGPHASASTASTCADLLGDQAAGCRAGSVTTTTTATSRPASPAARS